MLNLTCVIQMLHFFIASYIIHALFLKKAVELINTKRSREAQLQKNITYAQAELARIIENKKTHWQAFVKKYQTLRPFIVEERTNISAEKKQEYSSVEYIQDEEKIERTLHAHIIKIVDYHV